jgi:hypothetical protein
LRRSRLPAGLWIWKPPWRSCCSSWGRFDAIVCESALAFVEDKPIAIRECVRVAKPGGYVEVNETVWMEEPPPERAEQAVE